MVVLGVAPGIRTLAYCVLIDRDGRWEIRDIDTLRGAGVAAAALAAFGASELVKKFRVHDLILSVIWERYSPKVLAVGPPANRKEDGRLVSAALAALRTMSQSYGMEYVDLSEMDELCSAIGCNSIRGIRNSIRKSVGIEMHTRDMALILATAAAVSAVIDKQNDHPEPEQLSNPDDLAAPCYQQTLQFAADEA